MITAVDRLDLLGAARALDQRADPDPEQRDPDADDDRGGDLERRTDPVLPEARLTRSPMRRIVAFAGGRAGSAGADRGGAKLAPWPAPASPARRCRRGPYLVVGLARSGQAAARLLAARGEQVIGVDAGSPAGAAGLAGVGVEVILDGGRDRALERGRCVVKSPGVPAEAPAIAAARRARPAGHRRARARLAAAAEPVRARSPARTARPRSTELLGHVWRTAGEPVAVAGNVGTPLASLVGELDRRGDGRLRGSSFQLEDTDAFAPECGVLLNVTPDHLDRHGDARRLPRRRSCASSPTRATTTSASTTAPTRRCAASTSAAAGAGSPSAPRAATATTARRRSPERLLELWGEPLLELSELALLGAHNAENAAAAAAAAAGDGDRPRGGRRRPARPSPASRTGSSGSREIDGVLYVNDSKATNVAAAARGAALVRRRRARDPRRLARRAAASPGSPQPVAERCAACYLIGEARRAARARPRRPPGRPGSSRRRCDARRRGRRRGRRRRAGRGRAARPGLRELRRLPRLRGSAASTSASPGRGAAVSAGSRGHERRKGGARRSSTRCCSPRRSACSRSASSWSSAPARRRSLLGESGDGAYYLKRTVLFGVVGLLVDALLVGPRRASCCAPLTPLLLAVAFVLCFAVLLPGIGIEVERRAALDRRRSAPDPALGDDEGRAGPLRRAACSRRGRRSSRRPRQLMPFLGVVGVGCALVVVEPDLGTAMVACLRGRGAAGRRRGEDARPRRCSPA